MESHPPFSPAEHDDDLRELLLALGAALTLTGESIGEIQERLRAIAAARGRPDARVSAGPTMLLVALGEQAPAGVREVDSTRSLRLDQASAVIHLADHIETSDIGAAEAVARLDAVLAMAPRHGAVVSILSHGALTVGLGLVIRPAAVDVSVYLGLGLLVGALRVWAARFSTGGYLMGIVAAAVVSAIAFLVHGGEEAASLRLTIPPLVMFLPGGLLTMAMVDLAMGETVTGASRFVAGLLQLTLLGIGIVVGAELIGDPHAGPTAGVVADTLGAWAPWAGVLIFGVAIAIHNSAPPGALPGLMVVLVAAWGGQLVGGEIVDTTLSGFVGAAVMVPVAHAVGRLPRAAPAHVMFLPAFWLLVPGTIGLIGITELVGGTHARLGVENFGTALAATGSVALGILVGTMVVRAARAARTTVVHASARPRARPLAPSARAGDAHPQPPTS